jgi:hypothetical protein
MVSPFKGSIRRRTIAAFHYAGSRGSPAVKRTKFSPVCPDDLATLTEMGLVQMKDDVPELTDEGHRALDLN